MRSLQPAAEHGSATVRAEVTELLQRLVACDTSNPPGREVQVVALLEDYLGRAGLECERVAKDPERPNLVARLRGSGGGPSLAFVGHADVVQARREDWSVEPFAGIQKDGAIWGRGTVDMKGQVAAAAVALATLAREGFRPRGDLMLIVTADEEVGDAGVGAPYLVEARPDLRPDYALGEGAGERILTAKGPIYLLDRGEKATVDVTVTVRGTAADASLPDLGENAVGELARLLARLVDYRSPVRIPRELEPLLEFLGTEGAAEERVEQARAAHPALDLVVGALVGTVIRPTVVRSKPPENVVPQEATVSVSCIVLPGTAKEDVEAELREALGPGRYELEVGDVQGGSVSPIDTPLQEAIAGFLAEQDPDATLVPALGYGYSDLHSLREAYGATAYGFIPFRSAEPMTNLTTKHAADEHVLVEDLVFQTEAALAIARTIGEQHGATALH